MIKRMISIILLLTSTTAFAADQSATIPNSRLLNEKPESAREKVNAYSLGKMEEGSTGQTDVMRVAILEDLAAAQKKFSTAPLNVAENYQSIFEKATLWRRTAPRNQAQLWDDVIRFFGEANSPSDWIAEDFDEAERLSKLPTADLRNEFEKNHPLKNVETGEYSLAKISWEIFRMDFTNFFIAILMTRQVIQRYEEMAADKKIDIKSHAGFLEAKKDLSRLLKLRLVLREWAYRHWDGSARPRSVRIARAEALPIAAGSLGTASGRIVMPIVVEEYYKSIYEKVRSHLAGTPQRAELQNAWTFTKKFLEEAQRPSVWLANETPVEAADTKRFSRMTTRDLEAEFYQYERFSYYELRAIKWEIFRADTIGNFMNGILVSRQMLLEDDFTPEEREIFTQRLTAARIFREWVYRHWDSSRRPASHVLFPSGASLGKQALVFQLASGLNKEILDKTAELMRSHPDKSVIFVVSRRRDGSAVSEALKARGLNVKGTPFEVNPLRTPGDSERFTKYVQGLQAKFPEKNGVAVIADFDVLSELDSKNIISIARDKAGKGSDQAPASIANIQSAEREGTDSVLFNLAWNILSSSGPEKFLDQIERDASTGVFFIRLDSLKSLLEYWLSEHKTAQSLLAAA